LPERGYEQRKCRFGFADASRPSWHMPDAGTTTDVHSAAQRAFEDANREL